MTTSFLKAMGLSDDHPFYQAWVRLKQRCNNSLSTQYEWYGGRGIGYDPSWESFFSFYNDMFGTWKKGLTLDRIDNDGHYSQENCRWTTMQTQAGNKRQYKLFVTNKSGVTNVYWNRTKQKWYAQAFENKMRIHLYAGASKEDAIKARRDWEAKSGKKFR